MNRYSCPLLAACLLLFSPLLLAGNAETETRMRTLTEELRCLVCQNQTLADSNADLAEDLRREIRTMMERGQSDREIIGYLVQRYGDFVLYRPPVKATTSLLWFGPPLFAAAGVAWLVLSLRRRLQVIPDGSASDDRLHLESFAAQEEEGGYP